MTKKSGRVNERKKTSSGLTNRKIQFYVGAVIVGVIIFGIVIPFTAMQFENHNSFCASCHTQGEHTFYERSTAKTPVDLASVHNIQGQARCIDCHTGPGIIGRYRGLLAGSTNLIAYFSGHYPQPSSLREPYPDANCLKCHDAITHKQEFNNHFHVFLTNWQAVDKNAAGCVSCHLSHDKSGDAKIGYLNQQTTAGVCKKCHAAITPDK